jgi:hypothetical protein
MLPTTSWEPKMSVKNIKVEKSEPLTIFYWSNATTVIF